MDALHEGIQELMLQWRGWMWFCIGKGWV